MGVYTITITEDHEKALLTDMKSIQEWLNNAINNKTRMCVDKVVEEALNDTTGTILTQNEKEGIVSQLASSGTIITTVKKLPEAIKIDIVNKAKVKSALERQKELEEEMGNKINASK